MIEPTQAYQNLPAIPPEQVEQLICKAMLSRKRTYAPWWLMMGQIASVLGRGLWEVAMSYYLRRNR